MTIEKTKDVQPQEAEPGLTTAASVRVVARTLGGYGIIFSFVALFVTLSFASDAFFSSDNLLNLVDGTAPVALIALGLTIVILAGQLDFSGGAVYGLAGIVAAQTADQIGASEALLLGIGVGAGIGLVNGLLVAYLRIDSFICTLATSIIVSGLGLVITKGSLTSVLDPEFGHLGNDSLLGATYATWIFGVVALALSFVTVRTVFGRYIFAVGDNSEAARLSGIPTRAVTAAAFVLSGTTAALGGVIVASQASQGQPGDGINLVLTAIAAVVVGGTSVTGGRGAIWRTVFGVLFLALIGNGLNLLSIDPVYQQIVQGSIILSAVAFDRLSRGTR